MALLEQIQAYDRLSIYLAVIVVILMLIQLLYLLKKYQETIPLVRVIIVSYLLMFLGIISIPIGVFFVILERSELIQFAPSIYSLTFAAYLIWIIAGNNYLYNKVLKLSEETKDTAKWFNRFLFLIYIITIVSLLRSIGVLGYWVPYQPDEENILFLFISLVSIFLFLLFFHSLGRELNSIESKLVKMRLSLTRSFLLLQEATIILIFLFAIVLLFLPASSLPIARFYLASLFCIVALFSGQVLVFSVSLPEFIRKKYDLSSNRFRSFVKLRETE